LKAEETAVPAGRCLRVVVLMPVYRDWPSAALVCRSLDKHLAKSEGIQTSILLVDDGSPEDACDWPEFERLSLERIEVLRLRRNLGHQRAIGVGLCYIHDHIACDAVLVMDSDGEDRPEDAVRLIEKAKADRARVFFAERRKRQEGIVFRGGYTVFRGVHWLLTGIPVRVGNFSVVPFRVIRRLVSMSELWNHFAGAVYKSKAQFACVPMDRGRRLQGKSHMNLAALVAHGIAGIATFHETVATRILISNVLGLALLTVLLAAVAAVRLMTKLAIPGWATLATGFVLVLAIQLVGISFSLVFTLISNRTSMMFVPSREYSLFVDWVQTLAEAH